MPATRTSSARPSTAHADSEPYPAQPGPFARTEGATWPRRLQASPGKCSSSWTAKQKKSSRSTHVAGTFACRDGHPEVVSERARLVLVCPWTPQDRDALEVFVCPADGVTLWPGATCRPNSKAGAARARQGCRAAAGRTRHVRPWQLTLSIPTRCACSPVTMRTILGRLSDCLLTPFPRHG